MTIERFAWVMAYLRYFEDERAPKVLEALGVEQQVFDAATREHNRRMSAALLEGDHAPAKQFADEFAFAKEKLSAQKPTMDDVRATYGKKVVENAKGGPSVDPSIDAANPDETAMLRAFLPQVVLPFQRGAVAKPPPAAPVMPKYDDDVGSGTVMAPSPLAKRSPAVPFAPAPPPAPPPPTDADLDRFNPDETFPMRPPKKV